MTPYEKIGVGYARTRRDDPRIAALIGTALGEARSVVNVGAGSGSYESAGRGVIAVEPSLRMITQRPDGAAPVLRGVAEALPLRDGTVDAALAILTLHHWSDQARAIAELHRVARSRIVILTYDPDWDGFWLTRDYFPEFVRQDRSRFPSLDCLRSMLEGAVRIDPLPIPKDCVDGFLGAFWKRPEAYLRPEVRAGISSFAEREPAELTPGLTRLAADLESGRWAEEHGAQLEELDAIPLGYRLVVAERGPHSGQEPGSFSEKI